MVAMICCAATIGPASAASAQPQGDAAWGRHGNAGQVRERAAEPASAGIIGSWLLLAVAGALAVVVAGLLLVRARPGRRDLAYVGLGAIGYLMLIGAALGLVLLAQ